MKTVLVSLAFAGLVAAQGSIPSCAQGCVNDITTGGSIGGCKPLDIACICENGSLLDNIACCLEKSCDEAGKEAAVKYAAQICGSAGVKDIPTAVVCKSDSQSFPVASRTSAASAASQTEQRQTTAASAATANASSGASAAASQTTGAAAANTSSSAQSTSTGAAAGFGSPLGMVGAGLLGMLAL